MDAYVFDGDIYCQDCATDDMAGPYADGGGEADTPQHCCNCGVFLQNPLTPDGYEYVREKVQDGRGSAVKAWANYYDLATDDDDEQE